MRWRPTLWLRRTGYVFLAVRMWREPVVDFGIVDWVKTPSVVEALDIVCGFEGTIFGR